MPIHDAVALYKTKAPRASKRRAGYEIVRQEDSGKTVIRVYGPIDSWEKTAAQFVEEIEAFGEGDELEIQVNSRGGDAWESMAIYDAIQASKAKITCVVLGIAASAAANIVCACPIRVIGRNAQFMIHEAETGLIGRASSMREVADRLDSLNNQCAEIYASASGQPVETTRAWMVETKWFRGQEAVDAGFFSSVLDVSMSAEIDEEDLREFDNVPQDLIEAVQAEASVVEPDQEVASVEEPAVEVVEPVEAPAPAMLAVELAPAAPVVDPQMRAAQEDPVVAALKSGAVEAPVMTARPVAAETAQSKSAPAPWTSRIAEMNAKFGRF